MKSMLTILLGILMFVSCKANAGDKGILEGCGNISSKAKALEKLEKTRWNEISLNRVQAMWPEKLAAFDCTHERCRSVANQGRIINGSWQCGEKVDLDRNSNSDGTFDVYLTVTMSFTAVSKEVVLKVAKTLARGCWARRERSLDNQWQA
jgi:hypothetical protein